MANKIRAEDLSKEIYKTLKQYADDVKVNSQEVAEIVAKDTVTELKQSSPNNTGKYRKNWTSESYTGGAVVYQKAPTYRLTHLLEKGHAKRGGGRVAAQPHIAHAEEMAIKQYEEKLIGRIGG